MERPDQSFEPLAPAFTDLSERAALHLPLRGPKPEELAALQAQPRFARRTGPRPPASSSSGSATASSTRW